MPAVLDNVKAQQAHFTALNSTTAVKDQQVICAGVVIGSRVLLISKFLHIMLDVLNIFYVHGMQQGLGMLQHAECATAVPYCDTATDPIGIKNPQQKSKSLLASLSHYHIAFGLIEHYPLWYEGLAQYTCVTCMQGLWGVKEKAHIEEARS